MPYTSFWKPITGLNEAVPLEHALECIFNGLETILETMRVVK